MNPRHRTLLTTLLTGALCLASALTHASGPTQFQAFISSTHTARASFSQTVTAQSGRKPQLSQGTLAFARPGRFRWVYDKPYYQLLVGDGTRLWIFDRDLNQVTVKKLGQALGASPAALLAGDNALDKNFIITDAGSADGLDFIEALPKNKDEGSFELVRIGLANNLPKIMIVHDNFGQRTTLTFSQFERNPTLAPDLFRFTPPKGADVVGE
ncbi:MAG: outer membrane lipoprotein chaperone LolA [Sterolibacterium sp.]|jgi:outer membrane lipoprotein carrier protein|nr:outer membrane lipoprotein chaperone LolA [Sterolibacterium sp.]